MEIKQILICGGGMMGKNIAFVFASNPEYRIGVYDLYQTDIYGGIRTNTKQLVDHGVLTDADVEDRLSRITFTTVRWCPGRIWSLRPCSRTWASSGKPLPSWRPAAVLTPFSVPIPPS